MINIIIADNQTLTREGIKHLLDDILDVRITGYAGNVAELEKLVTQNTRLLIIDPFYNQRFTLSNISDIVTGFDHMKVMILTNRQHKTDLQKIIDMGIRNIVFKECSREELVNGLYNSANGDQFFCRNTYEALFGSKLVAEKEEVMPELSSRETELIHLIANGLTNKDIAEKLFLSIHTVKTHRRNIIKKLGFTFKNIADISSYIETTR